MALSRLLNWEIIEHVHNFRRGFRPSTLCAVGQTFFQLAHQSIEPGIEEAVLVRGNVALLGLALTKTTFPFLAFPRSMRAFSS
jgi:hypothetical protein